MNWRRAYGFLLGVAALAAHGVYCQSITIVVNGENKPITTWRSSPQTILPSQENTLQIDLVLPNGAPGYAYRFWQNRKAEWQPIKTTTRLYYHNLSGDEYQFEVRRYTQAPFFQHRFLVENALWQRWWFVPSLFGYGLVVVGILMYLFYRYRIRQFMRMQQVRDRIARDLHDDMGSYLSSISILSQTAQRNAIRNPEKAQNALDSIGQTARQVMEAMNDMVWSINPSHDSMAHVVSRMTDVGNSLFAETEVDFQLQIADSVGTFPLTAEARRDFFLIYKEAITNAARYAQASRVRVSLQRTQHDLVLTVQDNGRGFNLQQPDFQNPGGGNGLHNMQTRAQHLGGELTVTSLPDEGTTVRLTLSQLGIS